MTLSEDLEAEQAEQFAFGDLIRVLWTLNPATMGAARELAQLLAEPGGIPAPAPLRPDTTLPAGSPQHATERAPATTPQTSVWVQSLAKVPWWQIGLGAAGTAYVLGVFVFVKGWARRSVLLLLGPAVASVGSLFVRRFRSGIYRSSMTLEQGGLSGAPWVLPSSVALREVERPRAPPSAAPPLFRSSESRGVLAASLTTTSRGGPVDIESLVKTLAQRCEVEAIPQRKRRSMSGGIQLLIERGPALRPFRRDVDMLESEVQRFAGPSVEPTVSFVGSPLYGIVCERRDHLAYVPQFVPRSGTRVIVVSDLGIGVPLAAAAAAPPEEWLELSRLLKRAACPTLFIVPYRLARLPRQLVARLPVVEWGPRTSSREIAALLSRFDR